jgi:hypothetical protein
VIAPAGSGAAACEVLTLRHALAAALPNGPSGGRGRPVSERSGAPIALVGDPGAIPPRTLHTARGGG